LSPGDVPVQQNQTRILTLSRQLCFAGAATVLGARGTCLSFAKTHAAKIARCAALAEPLNYVVL